MKIYKVEIINKSWDGYSFYLEKYFKLKEDASTYKNKFESIRNIYEEFYSEFVEEDYIDFNEVDNLKFCIYMKRSEFLCSSCSVTEINVL